MTGIIVASCIGLIALVVAGGLVWAIAEWEAIEDPHIYFADDDHGGKHGN